MPPSHALNFVEEFFYKNLKNEKFYVYMGILSVFLFASMFFFTLRYSDYIFNLREVVMIDEGIRPILNFLVAVSAHGTLFLFLVLYLEG